MTLLEHVSQRFGDRPDAVIALDERPMQVTHRQVLGAVEQLGADRSTLLRAVNALERRNSGRVSVDRLDITAVSGGALRLPIGSEL